MKVLGMIFSPRKGGNTEILVKEALAGAMSAGAETELLTTADKNIKPCDACRSCEKTGECHINDNMQEIYKKLLEADGIILGTPVYFWSMCGQAKIFLDRTVALRYPYLKLANKVGGAVAVATRTGAVNTLNIFERYFISNHMLPAESVEGLAKEKGEIRKDEHAMKSALELGRQIVLLIKRKFTFPEEFDLPINKLVHKKYKVALYPVGASAYVLPGRNKYHERDR